MIWLLIASQIADAYSTHVLLKRGGTEGNPFVAYVLARWGFWPWTLGKLAVGLGVGVLAPSWLVALAAAAFFGLAARNLWLVR